MATRHNLDSEDDGTTTQPATSCCSGQEENNDEQLEEAIQVHASYDNANATWKNGSGQRQSIDDILLKVDIDNLASKAIFRVICRLWIKGKGKNRTQLKGIGSQAGDKQPVFLFLHPENIRAITLEVEHDKPSLHFSMGQGSSRLVIPNDCILECKNSMHTRFLSFRALADTNDFTIHFKGVGMSKLLRSHLSQIASVFSASNTKRPETDHRRIDLQSLYNGVGGHVFDTSATLAGANDERDQALPEDTPAPPPIDYEPSRDHKPLRKRKRERERESSDADYDRPPMFHAKSLIEHLLDMENRLRNDMKTMIESTETRLKDDMKHMVESAENRLRDDVKDMIQSSEDRLRNHVKDVVEATENHLKDEMNDMLDSRADEIDQRVDGAVDDLRTECIGTIESEFRYLKYGVEEVTKGMEEAEEKMRGVLETLDEAGDGVERRVGRFLNGIRLQVTVDEE